MSFCPPRPKRRVSFPTALPTALLCLLPLSALPAAPAAPAATPGSAASSISALKTARSGRQTFYEITVTSTAEFPMRDEAVVLAIGGQEFSYSRYLPGGDMNTLVFSVTAKQFAALPSGAAATVYYGHDDAALPAARWNLGSFDKSLLDRAPVGGPAGGPALTDTVKSGTVKSGATKPAPASRPRKAHN